MTIKERYAFVVEWFLENDPHPQTELCYSNPFELLVAVILSAQCTDKRINIVTPPLFEAYPTAEEMSKASFEDINRYIKSVSFANNKTRHLIGMSKILTDKYNGEVPSTVELLEELPGVGRKTANVITSVIYGQQNLAVDTHVFRVAARIGLTRNAKNPLQAEEQLVRHLPPLLIRDAHHWLILHGRYICVARRPKCEICSLKPACKYYNTMMQKANELIQK